jgi:hypothetical protein
MRIQISLREEQRLFIACVKDTFNRGADRFTCEVFPMIKKLGDTLLRASEASF